MEFSSTSTYANRYDLDEIDVFLEGDSNNPMYFDVTGLPPHLSFGKHYFYLSILDSTNQDYQLRPYSRILFEFKSINNVIIKSDVTEIDQQNGVATCFVEVLQNPLRTYEEVQDGEGTLNIVGSLENKPLNIYPHHLGPPNNLSALSAPIPQSNIPQQFEGAINYRCTFPISIRKNLMNADSPTLMHSTHKLSTAKGEFSFIHASITTPAGAISGLTMDSLTGLPTNAVSVEKGGS